jgi:hypothetical protein
MTDEQILDFLDARAWSLAQTDRWPTKRLEFAGDEGQVLAVEGCNIRAMVREACSMTDYLSRGA